MTNEEFEREIKRLEERIEDQINSLRIKFLESKADKKPYELEVPEDINHLAYLDEDGYCIPLEDYDYKNKKNIYFRGLAFETREEAEQYDKERILLFKLHKWAEEHNGDWMHNLKDLDREKYIIRYDYEDNQFTYVYSYCHNDFSKLPIFKSEEIAEQFIKEFGDEIKEVFC